MEMTSGFALEPMMAGFSHHLKGCHAAAPRPCPGAGRLPVFSRFSPPAHFRLPAFSSQPLHSSPVGVRGHSVTIGRRFCSWVVCHAAASQEPCRCRGDAMTPVRFVPSQETLMKRFSTIVAMLFVLVGLMAADSASAAGRGRRGSSCDCGPTCAAEPACGAAEPACCAAEPACAAAEPACCAAEPSCCEPRRRGRARSGLLSRRAKNSCGDSCTSCCGEPSCGAEPACNAGCSGS